MEDKRVTNTDVYREILHTRGGGARTAAVGPAQVWGSASDHAWDKPAGRLPWLLISMTSPRTGRVDR